MSLTDRLEFGHQRVDAVVVGIVGGTGLAMANKLDHKQSVMLAELLSIEVPLSIAR